VIPVHEELALTQGGLEAGAMEPAASAQEQPVAQAEEQKPGEVKIPGGKIVQNEVADRLQIFFDEKPLEAMCTNLNRNAKLWLLAGGS
jgi:hypothetical protein